MPIRIGLGQGDYLTPMNAHDLMQIEGSYFQRCVMCREELTDETKTVCIDCSFVYYIDGPKIIQVFTH